MTRVGAQAPGSSFSENATPYATSKVDRVIVASPRGFCAGVEKAIKALAWMVKSFDPPIYCYHEIVHNRQVVERFESLGVVFVEDIAQVPPGVPLVLSAHGAAPEVVRRAREKNRFVVDAVCPLVTKVHHEVKVRSSKGYQIIYVGHTGHEEAIGTMAVAPDAVHLVTTVADVDEVANKIGIDIPVALLAQTTLSQDDWKDIMDYVVDKFPNVWLPDRSDLCFATTNRQSALKQLVRSCDSVIIIGSINSSNTQALVKVAQAQIAISLGDDSLSSIKDESDSREVHRLLEPVAGQQRLQRPQLRDRRNSGQLHRVLRINHAGELPSDLEGIIGITAGASAPEYLVQEVISALSPVNGVEQLVVTEEDEYFPPPPELRNLLKDGVSDRTTSAAQMLEELS